MVNKTFGKRAKCGYAELLKRLFYLVHAVCLIFLLIGTSGCGTFVARRMTQAPNTYPTWFAPKARVMLGFNSKFLGAFPTNTVEVWPPTARLRYRIIEPADYRLKVTSTNWIEHEKRKFDFSFHATVPGLTNRWTGSPRGTIVLLHGYGLAQFSMAPWALRLAEEGWRCVLVDLRGHGKSTGKQIFFGTVETNDLSQLLDKLAADGRVSGSVAVMGESYGGALALRWETIEPRVKSVIAIAPYATLSNSVMNIAGDYAGWMPRIFIKSGLKKLPGVLAVNPGDLDTTTVLRRHPVEALFVAADDDKVVTLPEVEALEKLASPGSKLVVVPQATHEALTYFFDAITPPILTWLERAQNNSAATGAQPDSLLGCDSTVLNAR